MTQTGAIGSLIEQTQGVVGAVLGTASGELRAVVGSVTNGDSGVAAVAVLTSELAAAGKLLGLGELDVASVKSASASRVLSRQAGAVLSIELDPRRPLGELETKLRTLAWAPPDIDEPTVEYAPPVPLHERMTEATRPPVPPGPTRRLTTQNLTRVERPTPQGMARTDRPTSQAMPRADRPTRPPSMGEPAPLPPPPGAPGRSMKSVGSGPVFSGDLEEFCVPDLLEFLRGSQRTGLLMCTTAGGTGTVQLSRGMIVNADSPHALDLREHLLTAVELSPEQRSTLAALPPDSFSDDALEDASELRDLVPRDELDRARVARIYSAFREMVGWTTGRFSFDPAVPVITNPSIALSAQSILMQLFEEQDEQAR
ncbi:MAG TPA: DUF4388 domain-containing protein [Kofleriaceae bacterium]|nr:DUF4388 domain-containing protein [Kofleriaceae bacterium]